MCQNMYEYDAECGRCGEWRRAEQVFLVQLAVWVVGGLAKARAGCVNSIVPQQYTTDSVVQPRRPVPLPLTLTVDVDVDFDATVPTGSTMKACVLPHGWQTMLVLDCFLQ